MQNEPIIRPIRIGEAPEAKRLIYSVAHPLMEPQMSLEELIDLWEGWGVLADLDDIQKNYFDNGGVFLIIEIGGHMVGTGAIKRYTESQLFSAGGRLRSGDESLRTGEGVCEVRRITLLPDFQRQKLGYALMLELIRRAGEMGYSKMVLWTDPIKLHRAVAFYRQLGFTEIPIDGIDTDELWMRMEIKKRAEPERDGSAHH
jgi:GNAT superfamily N-acetyltransferase